MVVIKGVLGRGLWLVLFAAAIAREMRSRCVILRRERGGAFGYRDSGLGTVVATARLRSTLAATCRLARSSTCQLP
nr:hypothetical protein [Gammaproteobacteria bacterium]